MHCRIAFFAIVTIPPFTELLYDYGYSHGAVSKEWATTGQEIEQDSGEPQRADAGGVAEEGSIEKIEIDQEATGKQQHEEEEDIFTERHKEEEDNTAERHKEKDSATEKHEDSKGEPQEHAGGQ